MTLKEIVKYFPHVDRPKLKMELVTPSTSVSSLLLTNIHVNMVAVTLIYTFPSQTTEY